MSSVISIGPLKWKHYYNSRVPFITIVKAFNGLPGYRRTFLVLLPEDYRSSKPGQGRHNPARNRVHFQILAYQLATDLLYGTRLTCIRLNSDFATFALILQNTPVFEMRGVRGLPPPP